MSAPRWIPSDAELDELARELPPVDPSVDAAEQNRTRLLAAAGTAAQLSRRSRAPLVIGGAALAAAAAVVLWLALPREASEPPKETIAALTDGARYERASDWPDFQLRVHDGRVSIRVASLAANERFRVIAIDAEIEARGARFVVEVVHDRVVSLIVDDGSATVRQPMEPPITVVAGSRWTPAQTAQRDTLLPPAAVQAPAPAAHVEAPPPAPSTSPSPTRVATTSPAATASKSPAVTASTPPATTAPEPPAATASKPPATASKPPATASKSPAVTASKPPTATVSKTPPATASNTKTAEPTRTAEPAKTVEPTRTAEPAKTVEPTKTEPVPASAGEIEFRKGWTALRAGDAKTAASSFATACAQLRGEALDEDACYWLGVAAKRAGDPVRARDALAAFLAQWPASPRAGEASALLGWLLYDAGDLDGAKRRFETAATDHSASVRESADRGITAIERKRAR